MEKREPRLPRSKRRFMLALAERVEHEMRVQRMELFGTMPFKGVKRNGHGKKA